MAVQVALWLAKRYPSTLISVFLTGFCYFSNQVTTQLSSRGWVDPVPDPVLPGIDPGTSWMAVRHVNHYNQAGGAF